MKKLNILRAIVQFLWIMSMLSVPVIVLLIPGVFFIDDFNFSINGNSIKVFDLVTKLIFVCYAVSYLLFIYVLFLFKNIIREFLRAKVFSELVIKNFHLIGIILSIVGLASTIISFIYRIHSKGKFQIDLGLSNNIITLCFGLFFMVLSEIFKISKNLKQENDLTI